MPYAPDLDRLLTPGARAEESDVLYLIERHRISDLDLPTGRLVACDPLVNAGDTEPFTVTVTPGRYPLVACVAVLHRDGAEWQRRVAALQLVVRDEPATMWEPALLAGQDPAPLAADEFYGFGVDAGTGALLDHAVARAVGAWEDERLDEVLIPAQYPTAPVPGLVTAVVPEAGDAQIATVTSGWGDGVYPTFVGRGTAGEIVTVVVDFLVLPRAEVR